MQSRPLLLQLGILCKSFHPQLLQSPGTQVLIQASFACQQCELVNAEAVRGKFCVSAGPAASRYECYLMAPRRPCLCCSFGFTGHAPRVLPSHA